MTGLYWFAAGVGVPLVVWFVLNGGDEGSSDDGGAGGDEGIAGLMFRLLPLSTVAFFLATFGVVGLVLGATDTGSGTTAASAVGAGLAAGALNSVLFRYLRRTESTTEVGDRQLAGAIGRVVLPVAAERRGRVAVTVGGQQVYLSARGLPDTAGELDVGTPVLVVEVEGGVARVTRLDPELT